MEVGFAPTEAKTDLIVDLQFTQDVSPSDVIKMDFSSVEESPSSTSVLRMKLASVDASAHHVYSSFVVSVAPTEEAEELCLVDARCGEDATLWDKKVLNLVLHMYSCIYCTHSSNYFQAMQQCKTSLRFNVLVEHV